MAAAVVVLVQATKNHLKYLVTGNDAETVNLDAAGAATPDLVTDCPAGPLRELLDDTYANQAAARSFVGGSSVRVSHVNEDVGYLTTLINITGGAGTPLRLTLTCRSTVRCILSVEYRDSISR